MKIRVSYTVELDEDRVALMVDWAGAIAYDTDRPRRLIVRDLLREYGTTGIQQASEFAYQQRVDLVNVEEEVT